MAKYDNKIVLGGGCFWCSEAIFKRLRGVVGVVPGYAGGILPNPTYEMVSSGNTRYAEVVEIEFQPWVISLEEILEVFWHMHDPTTLNRQGNDVGSQYRSVIFYSNNEQKEIAEKMKRELGEKIVTKIEPLDKFYPAESYHVDYFRRNGYLPYCQVVILPKLEYLEEKYRDKLSY